jgi:transposase InsO family protein
VNYGPPLAALLAEEIHKYKVTPLPKLAQSYLPYWYSDHAFKHLRGALGYISLTSFFLLASAPLIVAKD